MKRIAIAVISMLLVNSIHAQQTDFEENKLPESNESDYRAPLKKMIDLWVSPRVELRCFTKSAIPPSYL